MKCYNCGNPELNYDGSCNQCGVFCVKVPMTSSVFIYARGQLADDPKELRNLRKGSVICYNHISGCPPPRFVAFEEE